MICTVGDIKFQRRIPHGISLFRVKNTPYNETIFLNKEIEMKTIQKLFSGDLTIGDVKKSSHGSCLGYIPNIRCCHHRGNRMEDFSNGQVSKVQRRIPHGISLFLSRPKHSL